MSEKQNKKLRLRQKLSESSKGYDSYNEQKADKSRQYLANRTNIDKQRLNNDLVDNLI